MIRKEMEYLTIELYWKFRNFKTIIKVNLLKNE